METLISHHQINYSIANKTTRHHQLAQEYRKVHILVQTYITNKDYILIYKSDKNKQKRSIKRRSIWLPKETRMKIKEE